MSYRVLAPLVLVRDGQGRHVHAYQGAVVTTILPEQRDYLLEVGFIEPITSAQVVALADAKTQREQQAARGEAERVARCLEALKGLDLPPGVGRPAVRSVLEARGHKFSNESIAAALRERRELSRTPGVPAPPLMVEGLNS